MKTLGYLVAIETGDDVDPDWLKDLIEGAIEYSSNLQQVAMKVDCESLGAIDVYPEEKESE